MPGSTALRRSVRRPAFGVGVVAFVLGATLPLSAQGPSRASQPTAPGWVFTPGISVGETFDTNVLLVGDGGETREDFLTAVTPRATLGFRGRHTTFHLDYRGSYQLYRELSQLNAFDQRATVSAERRVSPYLTLFLRNSLSKSPTTDELDIPGVAFRRQGVMMDDLRAGVDARFSRRSSLRAAYTFQWIRFDGLTEAQLNDALRRGGHSNGASAQFDYRLTPRLSFGAELEGRRATVDVTRDFDAQSALGVIDLRLSERFSLSGGAGYSWLSTDEIDSRRSAPAFRVNLSRSGARVAWNVGYRKSFLPSFGFGGTFENQELEGSFLAPLTRRLDLSGSLSVRAAGTPFGLDPVVAVVSGHALVARRRLLCCRVSGLAPARRSDQSLEDRHPGRDIHSHEGPLDGRAKPAPA
jgi:hypothetical protein